jgi:hypothetical protein
MKLLAEKGYLVLAQNSGDIDYVQMARVLARSIRSVEPQAQICLLTDVDVPAGDEFNLVTLFPFGDRARESTWKLQNDWQCFYASPFRETIKLEADMLIPTNISHWFDICSERPVVLTHGARNYLGELSDRRDYRRLFDANDLPDIYNAATYWRRSQEAREFFDTVRSIFESWAQVMSVLKYTQDEPLNTDLAYAIAAKILGPDRFRLLGDVPGLVHMKPAINGLVSEDWTKELVWELEPGSFRINTIQQLWPVHYHVKTFADEIIRSHGRTT